MTKRLHGYLTQKNNDEITLPQYDLQDIIIGNLVEAEVEVEDNEKR